MTRGLISRPKVKESIIPQHEVERGNDELAFMLKHRYEGSDTSEIQTAYFISQFKCPYGHSQQYESFKETFYHFREEHYKPTMSLKPDNRDDFKPVATKTYEQQKEQLAWEVQEQRLLITSIESTYYGGYADRSKLGQAKRVLTMVTDRYEMFVKHKSNFIERQIDGLIDDIEKTKEEHNRTYAMFQYCLIIEVNTKKGGGKGPKVNDRLRRKYVAMYELAKDFLFTDKQLSVMFRMDEAKIRKYLYYGLDMHYGGEQNYPQWMQNIMKLEQPLHND